MRLSGSANAACVMAWIFVQLVVSEYLLKVVATSLVWLDGIMRC
jgi:hypothetical protein